MSEFNSREALNEASVDELLNVGFDEIYDLPDFITPPESYIKAIIKSFKVVDVQFRDEEVKALELNLSLTETLELVHAEDSEPVVGSFMSQRFTGGLGVAAVKKLFGNVIQAWGVTNLEELMQKAEGAEIAFKVKHRKIKDKDTKEVKVFWSMSDVYPV